MQHNTIKGQNNVPKTAVKYHFSKYWKEWVRTWFTVETSKKGNYFRQHIAFSNERNKEWDKWQAKPTAAK